ncbi:MAG: TauD/TfdA family dioxygenase [Gammaproteobacteria bacterium]|nr:TauD/TfdA family dioxygenase [Gammaproteobacteria bacterium]
MTVASLVEVAMAEVSAHAREAAVAMTIEPTDATLGALVRGVRLAAMTDAEWNAIHAAFLDRGVLVFPGQFLTDAEQMDFGRRFGELMIESQPFSNERADGSLRGKDDPVMQLFRGNESWHTDSSFQPVSAKASILSARKVPATGGETEWADMRAAYEALDDGMRHRVASLCAHHSLYYSQQRIGAAGDVTAKGLAELHGAAGPGSAAGEDDGGASMPGYRQEQVVPLRPLVKVHPETGRPALYIGRHAHDIPGLSEEESRLLLEELVEFGCQPPRVYGHHWQVGDVVIWDNRRVLHRARPWPPSEARAMHHTRVAGDPATETALNVH